LTHASLSLYKSVGEERPSMEWPLLETLREISKVHDLFQCSVSGQNFILTRAERHTLLTLAKPTNRSTILEIDAAIHSPKLEEREKGAICNCVANL
jgi:hypothetical protein